MLLRGAHWEPLARGLDIKEVKDIASTTVCQGLTATRNQEDAGARKGLDIGGSSGAAVPPAGGSLLVLSSASSDSFSKVAGHPGFPS